MVKIIGVLACLAVIGSIGIGCKPKDVTKNIPVSDFKKIVVTGSGNVVWAQGSKPSCEISGIEKQVNWMRAEVVGDTLMISNSGGLPGKEAVHINVKSSNLDDISVEGISYLNAMGIKADKVSVQMKGLGEVRLFGSAKSLDLIMDGSCHFDSIKLNAENVKVNLEGTCKANVQATKSLKAKASGVSKVFYTGNPPTVEQSAENMSKIEPM
jgi:hypothetical protein